MTVTQTVSSGTSGYVEPTNSVYPGATNIPWGPYRPAQPTYQWIWPYYVYPPKVEKCPCCGYCPSCGRSDKDDEKK